ncbi:MAG: hypothetical protein AABZ77_01315 [Chloroflexota bacterium]
MPTINFDISDFDQKLYKQSIILITCFAIFAYDATTCRVSETAAADDIRKQLADKNQVIPSWLSFSAGYELLFKAVLLRHKTIPITKGHVSVRINKDLLESPSIAAIQNVYSFVDAAMVSASNNDYLQRELNKQKIKHLYDFSTGQLGGLIGTLRKLLDKNVISPDERAILNNATWTLLDLRRNVDAHTFYGLIVSRSLNKDLENVYLPAINLLLDVYNRPAV